MRGVAFFFVLISAASVADAGLHGFLYTSSGITVLRAPGATDTDATSINDAGQIAINSSAGPFVYESGSYTPILGFLHNSGVGCCGHLGINDADQVAGELFIPPDRHLGFVHGLGTDTLTSLDVPGSLNTTASGINDAGQVVGSYMDGSLGVHGFVYSAGTFTTVDVPGRTDAVVNDINDVGQMVGFSGDQGWFRDTDGSFTTLMVPGSILTAAGGINNAGQIVGSFAEGEGRNFHGFFYSGGSYTIINVPGAFDTYLSDINDAGQMVGLTGEIIPEPSSMLVFGSGLIGVWAASSRKRRFDERSGSRRLLR
jgi:probable HAF family extracellular repeat protein